MERLAGRVVGDGSWVAASLTVGDETMHHAPDPGPMTVALDDGTTVEVRQRGADLGPTRTDRDQWEDLMDDPRAAPFHDEAPGPHVKVTLEGVAVRPGDRVVVEGEVERRPVTEGYRGSEGTTITAVRAVRIGVGDGAEAWLDEQAERAAEPGESSEPALAVPSQPKRRGPAALPIRGTLIALALALLATGAGLAAWLLDLGWNATRFLVLGLGLQLAITSVYKLATRRPLPWMVEVGKHEEGHGLLWGNTSGFAMLFVGWAVVLFAWGGVALEAASYAVAGLMAVGLSAWVLAAILFWSKRRDARALRLLLRARKSDGDGWGRREGTVVSGGLSWDRTHELNSSTSTESYVDSEGRQQTRQVTRTWYDFRQHVGSDPTVIEAGDERIHVTATGGLWGSADFAVDPSMKLTVRARPGDSLAVVGRFEDGKVKKGGPESLFLFSARGESATKAARRAMLMHRLTLVSLFLLGGLGLVVGWVNPVQSHLRLEAEVVTSADPAIAIGDLCTIDIGYRPGNELASDPHRCQVSATCGGKQVYGGWSAMGMGYFDCDAENLRGDDYGADDEDGAIDLQGDRGSADHGDGRVLFRFLR